MAFSRPLEAIDMLLRLYEAEPEQWKENLNRAPRPFRISLLEMSCSLFVVSKHAFKMT